jgi:hypothetical protein
MHHVRVIVSFKIKRAWIRFIYMDGCLEDLGGSLHVWNHFFKTLIYMFVELQIGQLSTMTNRWVIVSFKIKSCWISFIYQDGRLEDFSASWFVWNHYLWTLIYMLLELQLGDFPSCPMCERLLVSKYKGPGSHSYIWMDVQKTLVLVCTVETSIWQPWYILWN